jgi:ubiquinone/menaquinone biosynthesis C-methylase UbiE
VSHHGDVERFSEWAPTYDRHWMQRWLFTPVQRVVMDLAAAEVPSPKAVLDVGCGTGRLLRAVHQRFPLARLDGVDAAAGMVEEARRSAGASPVHFQQAVAEELPFPDASFDLVTSTLTFHHWSDQATGIAEVKRVLRPHGKWVLADFIATGPASVVLRVLHADRMPELRRLQGMLDTAGLGISSGRSVWRTMGQISVVAIGAATK